MSGDVQPRKRKDKKRKKDELGLEESRGTSAVFGDGDVFMHSQHDHGTGGHWCAKIIFFSLLAVLVTLIGLIILENRGLTELEANAVESRYSGVLDGWIEDSPSDDHHDEHTLELKNHNDEGGDHDNEDDDHEDEDSELERDVSDENPISTELPALPEPDDDITEKQIGEHHLKVEENSEEDEDNDEDFIASDDDFDAPIVEHITVPAGKPFVEVEETSSEQAAPVPDTLAEEEEYEKQQEELRREEEQASHMWLKLGVGAALLAATHVVVRRVTASPDVSEGDETSNKSKSSTAVDRRMTLIPEETSVPVTPETELIPQYSNPIAFEEIEKSVPFIRQSDEISNDGSDDEIKIDEQLDAQNIQTTITSEPVLLDQELYSEDDDEVEDNEDEMFLEKRIQGREEKLEHGLAVETEEEVPDDVEIIDDETLEEEIDEEEISDVDDAELLSRLEAKYGRLPEPERFTPKYSKRGSEFVSLKFSLYLFIAEGMIPLLTFNTKWA